MTRILTGLAAGAALLGVVAAPSAANAFVPAAAAAIAGGAVLGGTALGAGAATSGYPYGYPGYAYGAYPGDAYAGNAYPAYGAGYAYPEYSYGYGYDDSGAYAPAVADTVTTAPRITVFEPRRTVVERVRVRPRVVTVAPRRIYRTYGSETYGRTYGTSGVYGRSHGADFRSTRDRKSVV